MLDTIRGGLRAVHVQVQDLQREFRRKRRELSQEPFGIGAGRAVESLREVHQAHWTLHALEALLNGEAILW
jgi:hypothetical protein